MSERRPRLEGKVAIVTGAGSRGEGVGNGKATATLFAREGAKVVLADIEIDRASETLADIEAEDGVASIFQANVTNDEDCRGLIEFAIEQYGRLDILDKILKSKGINSIRGTFGKAGLEQEKALRCMRMFAEEVMPNFVDEPVPAAR
ncbi:MAG: SDR family NAD(P)-dependent oxidoreductase [Chloroflexi bacterium]|nr:SDR family NAD(P)-dependent oxidoreductase [Chloroflexota bacterium]